nr:unnamed protein product [Callosobruchus analis]
MSRRCLTIKELEEIILNDIEFEEGPRVSAGLEDSDSDLPDAKSEHTDHVTESEQEFSDGDNFQDNSGVDSLDQKCASKVDKYRPATVKSRLRLVNQINRLYFGKVCLVRYDPSRYGPPYGTPPAAAFAPPPSRYAYEYSAECGHVSGGPTAGQGGSGRVDGPVTPELFLLTFTPLSECPARNPLVTSDMTIKQISEFRNTNFISKGVMIFSMPNIHDLLPHISISLPQPGRKCFTKAISE